MELHALQRRVDHYLELLGPEGRADLDERLAALEHAYPFTAFDYTLMYLQHRGVLSFDSYEDLRAIYVSANPNLRLFELDPRTFGEDWGPEHLMGLHPELVAGDRALDPAFDGEYELWLEGVRVGVRAARAMDAEMPGSLLEKALRHGTDRPFFMNFQQLDLEHTDVFVLIGVWVDTLVYWVLSRDEVEANKYLMHQKRGGMGYQLSLKSATVDEFNGYLTSPAEIAPRIFAHYFTTKEKGKGTGLGLAVAYGIVKAHGGVINVAASHGGGAAFEVALPMHRMES